MNNFGFTSDAGINEIEEIKENEESKKYEDATITTSTTTTPQSKTIATPQAHVGHVQDGWRAFFTVVFFFSSTFQNFGNARTLAIFFKEWKE